MSYDITFCSSKECTHTECRRHLNNAPKDIPVSVADFSEDSKFCEYREKQLKNKGKLKFDINQRDLIERGE